MDLLLFSASAAVAVYDLKTKQKAEDLPVAEISLSFPSIVLSETPVIGLLFAAGWCDDCWDTVPVIEKVAASRPLDVKIHYVSSDRTEEEMIQFCNSKVFASIPFGNELERSALKRHFQACAKKEMEHVGVKERKHGTPTLILLESATGRVLTTNGVEDCMKNAQSPEKAVEAWKSLLKG